MLLTITSTTAPARDLGFLLRKHPDRVQRFDVPSGHAYVFYPEATDERCTAALMLDIDPISLVRGKETSPEEKHMGSRAAIVLARDEPAARRRFGVETGRDAHGTRVLFRRPARPRQ